MTLYSSLTDQIKRFVSLNPDEEAFINGLFTPKSLPRGGYFLREGETCRQVAFVQKGLFRYFINREGEELTYFFSEESQFVSEYESFLSGQPTHKNIQALEEAEILVITPEKLQRLYREVREGERFGRLVAERLFVDTIRQITSLYRDPTQVRYADFVKNFPAIGQRIPQYYIASYVGVKPQSLSRIRNRLAK
ncbi:MAG: Crp/Fnr family transcriptional regulator [Ferruginibacter sp.]|nr:Crp/Fnr family transcriptional regulator [Cytophagales bacterium]